MNELLNIWTAVLLVAVLNVIGRCAKAVKRFPDEAIPFLLVVIGGLAYPFIGKLAPLPFLEKVEPGIALSVVYVCVGVLCGGFAVWGNQAFRQGKAFLNGETDKPAHDENGPGGFTLIELLVIIAIVSALFATWHFVRHIN